MDHSGKVGFSIPAHAGNVEIPSLSEIPREPQSVELGGIVEMTSSWAPATDRETGSLRGLTHGRQDQNKARCLLQR